MYNNFLLISHKGCSTFVMNKLNISIVEHIRVENLNLSVPLTALIKIFYGLPILKIFKLK